MAEMKGCNIEVIFEKYFNRDMPDIFYKDSSIGVKRASEYKKKRQKWHSTKKLLFTCFNIFPGIDHLPHQIRLHGKMKIPIIPPS